MHDVIKISQGEAPCKYNDKHRAPKEVNRYIASGKEDDMTEGERYEILDDDVTVFSEKCRQCARN